MAISPVPAVKAFCDRFAVLSKLAVDRLPVFPYTNAADSLINRTIRDAGGWLHVSSLSVDLQVAWGGCRLAFGQVQYCQSRFEDSRRHEKHGKVANRRPDSIGSRRKGKAMRAATHVGDAGVGREMQSTEKGVSSVVKM